MNVLLIDTAGAAGKVALARAQQDGLCTVIAEQTLGARAYSAELAPAVQAIVRDAGMKMSEIDLFAAVSGPGSFTGLRVGLATVKGLAEALNKPVVLLSALAVVASKGRAEKAIALIDAGRGEEYAGEYAERGRKCIRETLATAVELEALVRGRGAETEVVTADEKIAAEFANVTLVAAATAADALALALEKFERGELADPLNFDANYIRRAEAELKR
jgi:tRNA threonylcarbamoyladenosine biosynthesis protein TsaB